MLSSHIRAKSNMVRPPALPVLIHALSSVSRHPVRSDSVFIVESRTGAVAWALCGNAPFSVPARQTGCAELGRARRPCTTARIAGANRTGRRSRRTHPFDQQLWFRFFRQPELNTLAAATTPLPSNRTYWPRTVRPWQISQADVCPTGHDLPSEMQSLASRDQTPAPIAIAEIDHAPPLARFHSPRGFDPGPCPPELCNPAVRRRPDLSRHIEPRSWRRPELRDVHAGRD